MSGTPGYYAWTTTPGTAFDSACWWEIIADHNHHATQHMVISDWATNFSHADIPHGYPLGVHLASTPPAGDFLPPSPILGNDSVALLPPGSAQESTWWDDLGRPTVDQQIDLVTGLPLVSSQDLALPFGGATFRLNRTRSAKHPIGRPTGGTWGSQAWWDWAGEGWMVSENPLLLIDSAVPDLVGDRPITCWLWLDAHHSIPFQYIESNDQYAAPPRFRARMHHNGDRSQQIEPTQFEVWLYDGQLKYTFVVIPEDVPPNAEWNPSSVSYISNPPAAGTTNFHDRPYSPDQVFAGSGTVWHNPWSLRKNPGVGIPRYGLCVKIEDRYGHVVDIEYHESARSLAEPDDAGAGCEDCVQQSRRKGLIKRVMLSTDGVTNWTLVYRHKMIWRAIGTVGGTSFGIPSTWTVAGASDAYKEAFSFPVIDRIYAFEHDDDGTGVTSTQVDGLQADLIILEEVEKIDDPIELDQSGPLDEFDTDTTYTGPTSTGWASIESRLRHIVAYHYDTPEGSGVQFDSELVKVRTVTIDEESGDKSVSTKVFKYTPELTQTEWWTDSPRHRRDIAWLEAVFTESDVRSVMLAKDADEDPIPAGLTVNHLALWRSVVQSGIDLDASTQQSDHDLAEQLRRSASLLISPGLYDNGSNGLIARWPSNTPTGGTWEAPSPAGLLASPSNDGRAYLSALGGDLTARNDGNWSTVGAASLTDSSGAERHMRIHRLMAFPNIDNPNGDSSYLDWDELPATTSAAPVNLDWYYYAEGPYAETDEARAIGYLQASALVNPYYLRSYERHANDALVSVGDLTKPRWIAIVDEFDSRKSMMEEAEEYEGEYLIKAGQISRRVVEMNAYGYILRDRTWTYTEDGYIREGGGLGEEFAYVTVEDYIDLASLDLPAWLDADDNDVIDDSADLRVLLDDIVQVEHRSVGWSVADNDSMIDEATNGIVRFIEYGLFGSDDDFDNMPLGVRFQKMAEGIKKGTYYTGTAFVPGSDPLYTRQYFRDPDRPSDITADVAFSGAAGPSTKLTSPPDIDQTPDLDVTMTRVLSAYDTTSSTGDSYLDKPLIARMVVGPPRQVRPGSNWFYPVEVEHYVEGVTEWSATGQLSHPIDPQETDYDNLINPDLSANTSPFNSLTWTYYKRDRHGRSDYTVLDSDESTQVTTDYDDFDIPLYPTGWERFPDAQTSAPHNFVTDFEYDPNGLSDVYYPNGFRWARRQFSEDVDEDGIKDWTYEFIFNDLASNGTGEYIATSPGEYRKYEGEDTRGVPEFDQRVRFLIDIDLDDPDFIEDTLVAAIKLAEDDPQTYTSPVERMAEILFAIDANGRLQRAEMMDYDPLGREMAIGYIEINDLGELFRERGIDGTISTQIRNSLGQTLRRYVGTVDLGWFGTQTGADNMKLRERIEYGEGVHDAWLPTVVRRYLDEPDWDDNGYDDHFKKVTVTDLEGIPTVTKYDWRMRPVVTQNHAKGDLTSSDILSTSVTYLDHADRPVLEATFGVGDPGLGAGTDPSAFEEDDLPPDPEDLFNLTVAPLSVVESVYGPDGTLVERRVYDTNWAYGVGTLEYTSEIMLNGLGGHPIYSQMVGAAAEVTRIDNLGRVAQVASIVPGTITGTDDGYELTRTDNTFDADGNVTMVRRWERVVSDTDPVLSESNAVCSTTVNWYDEKKRLVATADLGTEDEDGVYENPTGSRYVWEAADVPYYLPASNTLDTQYLPGSAQVWIYVYGDGNPSTPASDDDEQMTHTVDPNGMVTKYEYTGTGQVWRKIENVAAANADERRCTQYEYRYGKIQQIIAYETYPIPPTDSNEDGFIDSVSYQQTIVAYDDAGDAGGLDPDNADGEYGGEIVDSTFAVVSRDGSLITTVHLPDPSTGMVNEASQTSLDATQSFKLRYNFAGQVAERIDAEDRSFRYTYDDLGRVAEIQVGYYTGSTYAVGYAITSGVPADRVAKVVYTYNNDNRVESVTAYDLSDSIISQNVYEHDGRANITREYQQYGAAVNTGTSPFIEYAWDYRETEFGPGSTQINQVLHPGHDRLASVLYPVPVSTQTARELTFGYGSTDSHSDKMGWLETIDSNLGSAQVAQLSYLGNGRRVRREQAGGEIEWKLHNTSAVGLFGLDSFGRIQYNAYANGSGSSVLYHGTHTYDKIGNLTAQVIQQAPYSGWTAHDRSRVNAYNTLGQLTGTEVGVATQSSGVWGVNSPKREDTWTLDTLGNWKGDSTNPGRLITGDLDSGSIAPSAGFWTWGVDGMSDTLEFTHATDQRNRIADLLHDFDGQSPVNITPVYDAAGNLTDDGTYLYQYDAWNRLVQVKKKSNGAMLRHYTFDGLGRLAKTTSPDNFTNRVEHHHYDGVRRVQTVVVSGLMSGGGALSSGDPELEQLALESEPPNESIEPENTNLAFASGQMGLTGQTFTVYREYVWGPGDAGVDEILVYYDSGDNAWWCLTDLTGDLIAVCDLGGANGTARVCAQWTYDAYGSVMSADHIHSFQRPNLGHKGLFLDRLDLANPLGPQLVPFAQSVYHNRNRAYIPQLGRFLQQDPNQSAVSLIAASPFHGRGAGAVAVAFSLDGLYGDGANLYQYLGSNPWMRNDPTGLSWDPFNIVDDYIAEDLASKAAFLQALGQGAKSAAIIGAQIASMFPGVGAVGELALVALGHTSPEEAILGVVGGAVGGKLLGEVLKFTSRFGVKFFKAATHYAGFSAVARRNFDEAGGIAGNASDLVRRKPDNMLCGCFAAGTVVWTAMGQVPIEDVRVGDWVYARDAEGQIVLRQVMDEIVTKDAALVYLTIEHEDGRVETLSTTDEHPFWVEQSQDFVRADELSPGDALRAATGASIVRGMSLSGDRTTVYNLTVDGVHTYLVGPDGVWVHNAECSWNAVREAYWKALGRLRPPRATVKVRRHSTGQIEYIEAIKELHHIDGRSGSNPHRIDNLQELWPWEHARIDPHRNTGYTVVEIIGFYD